METSLVPERPVRPVAPYLGGKRHLAARIIRRIEAIPHRAYVEPFAGLGGVFLRRPHRAPVEVINDLSGDVAGLFRVLQRHYEALMDMLRWQLTSREQFTRLRDANPATLTDLERAARFLYLQRTSYGGKLTGRTFGVDARQPGRFDVTKLASVLEDVHTRLAGVTVEQLPFDTLIARYDRPEALFYCDPPYWGSEADYGGELFNAADFTRLAEALRRAKGAFLVSLNDVPAMRALFAGFRIEVEEVVYTINKSEAKRVGELVISNR